MRKYYIYSLSYKNQLLYIGQSAYPLRRMTTHVMTGVNLYANGAANAKPLYAYLNNLAINDQLPEFDILGSIEAEDDSKARLWESNLINWLEPIFNIRGARTGYKPPTVKVIDQEIPRIKSNELYWAMAAKRERVRRKYGIIEDEFLVTAEHVIDRGAYYKNLIKHEWEFIGEIVSIT